MMYFVTSVGPAKCAYELHSRIAWFYGHLWVKKQINDSLVKVVKVLISGKQPLEATELRKLEVHCLQIINDITDLEKAACDKRIQEICQDIEMYKAIVQLYGKHAHVMENREEMRKENAVEALHFFRLILGDLFSDDLTFEKARQTWLRYGDFTPPVNHLENVLYQIVRALPRYSALYHCTLPYHLLHQNLVGLIKQSDIDPHRKDVLVKVCAYNDDEGLCTFFACPNGDRCGCDEYTKFIATKLYGMRRRFVEEIRPSHTLARAASAVL